MRDMQQLGNGSSFPLEQNTMVRTDIGHYRGFFLNY